MDVTKSKDKNIVMAPGTGFMFLELSQKNRINMNVTKSNK